MSSFKQYTYVGVPRGLHCDKCERRIEFGEGFYQDPQRRGHRYCQHCFDKFKIDESERKVQLGVKKKQRKRVIKEEASTISQEILDLWDKYHKPSLNYRRKYGLPTKYSCKICKIPFEAGEKVAEITYINKSVGVYHEKCWKVLKGEKENE